MNKRILIALSLFVGFLFSCSNDDKFLPPPEIDPDALVNTQWAAHDTIPFIYTDTGGVIYPLISTYHLSLGKTDFTLDVQEVALDQPCLANDTAYQVTGTYTFEPPILYLRSATETIEAEVDKHVTEITLGPGQYHTVLRAIDN